MTSHRRSRTALIVLISACSLLFMGLSTPANAASTGKVLGFVKVDGAAVKGARVYVEESTNEGETFQRIAKARTTTNAYGSYAVSGIKVSDQDAYRVKIVDPAHKVVTTVRNFTARAGKTVTRNVSMKKAATLSGSVTRDDGKVGIGITTIKVLGPDVQIGNPDNIELAYDDEIPVHTNGKFTFVGLPAGAYRIQFIDPSKKYADQCYDNVSAKYDDSQWPGCLPDVTPETKTVTLAGGQSATLDPQKLTHPANRITGKVTNTSGRIIQGIDVTAFPKGNGSTNGTLWGSRSHSTGVFQDKGLPAGEWQLYVVDHRWGLWANQWYDDKTTQSASKVLTVGPGVNVDGLTIKVRSRAVLKVTGTAGTKSAKFSIDVTRKATGSKTNATVTITSGDITKTVTLVNGRATVTVTGVPSGTRKFRVRYNGTNSTAPLWKELTLKVK